MSAAYIWPRLFDRMWMANEWVNVVCMMVDGHIIAFTRFIATRKRAEKKSAETLCVWSVDTKLLVEDCFYPLIIIIFTASMQATAYFVAGEELQLLRINFAFFFSFFFLFVAVCWLSHRGQAGWAPCQRFFIILSFAWHKPRNRNYYNWLLWPVLLHSCSLACIYKSIA